MAVVIRRATREDAGILTAFAERTFRQTYGDSNEAADMDEHCARAYSPAQQLLEICDTAIDTILAIMPSGTLAGYAMVRDTSPPSSVRGLSPLEIWRFYVERAFHGQGVAQELMEACVRAARARGGTTLWLGVWEHNPRAQAFYRKMGFAQVGKHVFVLGQDRQTDRILVRSL